MQHDIQTKPPGELPFTHCVRLSLRQWLAALLIVALVAAALPRLWWCAERFDVGDDYRIPYALSDDYALFDRYVQKRVDAKPVFVLGDSVVWGEYVKSDGALSHFLTAQAETNARFVNAGINGLYPLALEGLVRSYGTSLRDGKVIVVFNALWLSSPAADLRVRRDDTVNHAALLPQFRPQIPGYQADVATRLGAVLGRQVAWLSWARHLQDAYFEQKSVTQWTLAEDPDRPRCYPNAYRNPLAQLRFEVPSGQRDDAERGAGSPRHKPWSAEGARKVTFEWVPLSDSLQWAAFQRTVELLRSRGNDVLVVVAPFNEHMVADSSMAGYRAIQSGAADWLAERGIPHVLPESLPSELYADASHPLTAGYEVFARQLQRSAAFRSWRP